MSKFPSEAIESKLKKVTLELKKNKAQFEKLEGLNNQVSYIRSK
jgi:hypothetical protein